MDGYTGRVLASYPLLLSLVTFACCSALAQSTPAAPEGNQPDAKTQQPAPDPVAPRPVRPRMPSKPLKGFTVPDEPEHPEPPARDFRDARYGVRFHVPAGWNFEKRDGIISNFGLETRTTRRRMDVRGVAAINFNPWPPTTFAGALFYYSVVPRSTVAQCADQTKTRGMKPQESAQVGGMTFRHGRDNHGAVCTEARDEAFTAMRGNACLRFDLVINTFCSETSGAQEISPDQLKDVQTRLAGILGSVTIGR